MYAKSTYGFFPPLFHSSGADGLNKLAGCSLLAIETNLPAQLVPWNGPRNPESCKPKRCGGFATIYTLSSLLLRHCAGLTVTKFQTNSIFAFRFLLFIRIDIPRRQVEKQSQDFSQRVGSSFEGGAVSPPAVLKVEWSSGEGSMLSHALFLQGHASHRGLRGQGVDRIQGEGDGCEERGWRGTRVTFGRVLVTIMRWVSGEECRESFLFCIGLISSPHLRVLESFFAEIVSMSFRTDTHHVWGV